MASDWEGVSIAFGGSLLDVSPSWTRIDNDVRVSDIEIKRGRQSEFETTQTGTATVQINDRSGFIDLASLDSAPIGLALRNPVSGEWFPLFRGVVDDAVSEYDRSTLVNRITISAVDGLDYLEGFQLQPGYSGFVNAQVNSGGYVFYEDTAGTVDDRIFALLEDANWPTGLASIFTGNVSVRESIYGAGETILAAIRDAADAEFPTVANFYIDKRGIAQFHGRFARFDPDGVSASASNWDFQRWKAGDNAAAEADGARAKLQPPFFVSRGRHMVRNVALAYPQGVDRVDLNAYIFEDAASIAAHNVRSWSAENLIVLAGITTGNTANQECQLYAQYIVENYANPRNRVPQLTIGSEHPTHGPFGAAAWALMCGVDISDAIDVTISSAGDSIAEEYYVEGLQYVMRKGPGSLDNSFPIMKMTADLTPTAYWASNPF